MLAPRALPATTLALPRPVQGLKQGVQGRLWGRGGPWAYPTLQTSDRGPTQGNPTPAQELTGSTPRPLQQAEHHPPKVILRQKAEGCLPTPRAHLAQTQGQCVYRIYVGQGAVGHGVAAIQGAPALHHHGLHAPTTHDLVQCLAECWDSGRYCTQVLRWKGKGSCQLSCHMRQGKQLRPLALRE